METVWYSLEITKIFMSLVASVKLMMNYSDEQLRRQAHLANGGTLANYDRSHYLEDTQEDT